MGRATGQGSSSGDFAVALVPARIRQGSNASNSSRVYLSMETDERLKSPAPCVKCGVVFSMESAKECPLCGLVKIVTVLKAALNRLTQMVRRGGIK